MSLWKGIAAVFVMGTISVGSHGLDAYDPAVYRHEALCSVSRALNMTPQRLQRILVSVRDRGTVSAESFGDVVRNEEVRFDNFEEDFAKKDDIMLAIVAYATLGRPKGETAIITDHIALLLTEPDQKLRSQRLWGVFDRLTARPLYMPDGALCSQAMHVVERYITSDNPENDLLVESVLLALGAVVLPEAADYLAEASSPRYWMRLTDPPATHNFAALSRWVNAAIRGICLLPPGVSIPILERLDSESSGSDAQSGRTVSECLDEAWRRRHGLAPLLEVYRIQGANPLLSIPYPEWLYGPGGTRIEWPFGCPESPRDRGFRKVHVDP